MAIDQSNCVFHCSYYINEHTGISGETTEVYNIIKTHIISHPSECFKMAANILAAQGKYSNNSMYKNNNISYKIILKMNTSLNNLQVWILIHCSHIEYFQRLILFYNNNQLLVQLDFK
jgi:hypothetical protein